jgi:uncharacterized membrane protein YgdD (TMEM256/DUF423 family)
MHIRQAMILAGLLGVLAVGLGAFGAHGLPSHLAGQGLDSSAIDGRLESFQTGVEYLVYHVLALVGLALWRDEAGRLVAPLAAWGMIVGSALFSGWLCTYAITGIKAWPLIAPTGGVCLMAAWLAVAMAAWRYRGN